MTLCHYSFRCSCGEEWLLSSDGSNGVWVNGAFLYIVNYLNCVWFHEYQEHKRSHMVESVI